MVVDIGGIPTIFDEKKIGEMKSRNTGENYSKKKVSKVSKVTFNEEAHSYTADSSGRKYISATTIIGQFKSPFDKVAVSTAYAKKHGQTPEYWQAEWAKISKIACDKGTAFHKRQEDAMIKTGAILKDKKLIPVHVKDTLEKSSHDYRNLPDGVYPELLMWNHYFELAGIADIITIEGNYFDIDDYKGLSLDTPIATKDGWKLMKDIQVGDIIFDGNGKLTEVEHVSAIHYNPCYKIVFDTNDELVADHEHKWVTSFRNGDGSNKEIELTTEELFKSFNNKEQPKIKCSKLELDEVELPIDPYILGVWLGDGNSHNGGITNTNSKTWQEIRNRGYKVGEDVSSDDRAEYRTVYGIYSKLKELDLIKNKHLPDIYARASHQQRLDLLRGLMDADGHFHRNRSRCVMCTTKLWQRDAIISLTSSLGYKPTHFTTKGKGFGNDTVTVYQICFTPTENPFLTRNEDYLEVVREVGKYSGYRNIKSIELIETVPTKCLAVKSKDHTYLAGKSFIKTHNTNKKIDRFSFCHPKTGYKNMLFPLQHLQDCNFNHYQLQLSIYAFMLEQLSGKKCRSICFHHHPAKADNPLEAQDEGIRYEVKYLKKEVLDMLAVYTKKDISQFK